MCSNKLKRERRNRGGELGPTGRALPVLASKLSLADQLLLTLSYWREYRTQFHVALSYGVHETTATRIIGKVEDTLAALDRFSLPKRLSLG